MSLNRIFKNSKLWQSELSMKFASVLKYFFYLKFYQNTKLYEIIGNDMRLLNIFNVMISLLIYFTILIKNRSLHDLYISLF